MDGRRQAIGHGGRNKPKEEVRIASIVDPQWDAAPLYFIGIDDTDNLESRGTGFRARQLAQDLQAAGIARLRGITRHQLFVSPEIPYTSHNSSACLAMNVRDADLPAVHAHCRAYLLRESADGSDAGLCVARASQVSGAVQIFGQRAKVEILTQTMAHTVAAAHDLCLEGLTGTHHGVIGALSAVGLHATRDDGRFLWMRGVRDLVPGRYSLSELRALTDIDAFLTIAGCEVAADVDHIRITEWTRPVYAGGRSVLFLEEDLHEQASGRSRGRSWRVAAKGFIKRY